MSALDDLRNSATIDQVASLLGFQTKYLSFVLYRIPVSARYTEFLIPKRSGGFRKILAPNPRLKLLQTRLAEHLYTCQSEILRLEKRTNIVSHGFEKERSIFTNAWHHKNRRYVLNLDLEDFFPSINFGRVYGLFRKNRNLALSHRAATLIAQIACHENQLPQGSPCSPVISNMIGHILDVRLTKLAKTTRCRYTRYADDITFSTNNRDFPSDLAFEPAPSSGKWVLASAINTTINQAGFKVHPSKTRMQCRPNRQTVTGLVVNEKVNIRSSYYRQARSRCHALFTTGMYHTGKPSATLPAPKPTPEMAHLEGVLAHIYHVKHQSDKRSGRLAKAKAVKDNRVSYPAYRTLYKDFLYYKRFVNLDRPLVVCEGKTDNIYLRCALRNLAHLYPRLASIKGNNLETLIRFLRHGSTEHDLLELSGGSAQLAALVGRYSKAIQKFEYRPVKFPVIVLVDNDSGGADVFSAMKKNCKVQPTLKTTDPFYFVGYNLYVVKTPEHGHSGASCIEDLFDKKLKDTKLNGKSFDKENDMDNSTHYGKFAFADHVVRPAVGIADFSGFIPLFDRIVAVLDDYKKKPKMP